MRRRILALTKILIKISIMFIVMGGVVLLNGYLSKASGNEKEGENIIVKKGSKVKIHYTVSIKDGALFDKSKKGNP